MGLIFLKKQFSYIIGAGGDSHGISVLDVEKGIESDGEEYISKRSASDFWEKQSLFTWKRTDFVCMGNGGIPVAGLPETGRSMCPSRHHLPLIFPITAVKMNINTIVMKDSITPTNNIPAANMR